MRASRWLIAVVGVVGLGVMAGVAVEPRPKPTPPDAASVPVVADPRLIVELYAAAPDIVHPIALDFDAKGRLLVVESHTHFRPANYTGPKTDRIRCFEDRDGDGQPDVITNFYEGNIATMDLAVHPDGTVFIATRNAIYRLPDADGNGVADEAKRIIHLETKGNYPHNGLAGLAFDARGDLIFGIGENLGEPYRLIGSDDQALAGGGEGGNVFTARADGSKLHRIATGFWNPFGATFDIYGRLFIVDNDPDASPPCRMLRVVEGGDYGYQFRYGRSGRHPFQAWNGELFGVLPMLTGTGESPCEVVSYESFGLPAEYRASLLVPAWADHRIERYVPDASGLAIQGDRRKFIEGGKEFRPSGLAVAPDGSLFITDWVSRSYDLHGKGAIWRVRWRDAVKPTGVGLASPDRRQRDREAHRLAQTAEGRAQLRDRLRDADVRVRAAALAALLVVDDREIDLMKMAMTDTDVAFRAMATRALVQRGADTTALLRAKAPREVEIEAIAGIREAKTAWEWFETAALDDPYRFHALVQLFARQPKWLLGLDAIKLTTDAQRALVLLAHRASGAVESRKWLARYLDDANPVVRFLAIKWVADERLSEFRPQLERLMKLPRLDPRTFTGLATALARLDDKPVNDDGLASYFLNVVNDRQAPMALRILALRGIPATNKRLTTDQLIDALKNDDADFRIEVLRTLKDRGDRQAMAAVQAIAADRQQAVAVRAQALTTLAAIGDVPIDFWLDQAESMEPILAAEALRGLVGQRLTEPQQQRLRKAAAGREVLAPLVARVLGQAFREQRPPTNDVAAWMKQFDAPGDAAVGRRIFEHPKLAGCYRCHAIEGRGANIGPELSTIGRSPNWLESILMPNNTVAPFYQTWAIETQDGRIRNGLLVGTNLDKSTYLDEKGGRFDVEAKDIAEIHAAPHSIMPINLLDVLTDAEVRDLFTYLRLAKP